MPIVYRALTALLGITGSLGLVITGEINPLMALGGAAAVPGYYRLLKGRAAAPQLLIGTFSLLAFSVFIFDSLVSGDFFLAVAHLTITIQAIKSFDIKEPWDNLQVYFVSLLQMVIASELSRSPVFGGVFVVFLALLVAAMVVSHYVKEGGAPGPSLKGAIALISILTLILTAVFFIILPRAGYKFFGKSHARGIKTSGFSDKVDFGSFGEIKLDPTVVMRVEVRGTVYPSYYWRGMSLDYFDGVSWKKSRHERQRAGRTGDLYLLTPYNRSKAVEQRIYLEPIDSDVIFGLPEIGGIAVDSFPVLKDDSGDVFLGRKASRRAYYTVYSEVRSSYPGNKDPIYLQLPSGLNRVGDLARAVTAKARTDKDKALMLERYLKGNYSYYLSSPTPSHGISPIEDFLFNSKRGYCEHFATAMVIMLRQLGIPARIVNGFYGGEKNTYGGGYVIVRQSDAHSWVEAMVDSSWEKFDPTPYVPAQHIPAFTLFLDSIGMKWSRYVVGFRADDQKTILRSLTSPLVLSSVYMRTSFKISALWYLVPLLAAVFACVYVIVNIARSGRHGFVSRKYVELRRITAKGSNNPASVTPREIIEAATGSSVEEEVREFIYLYEAHRFGQVRMSPPDRKKYLHLLKQIIKGRRASRKVGPLSI